MKKKIILLLLTLVIIISGCNVKDNETCTSGWKVTGYYTPDEKDFSGTLTKINTDKGKRMIKEDFLDTVKIEGWGKTLAEDYLGHYHDSWHINDFDSDAQGNELIEGTVAVDPSVVDPGTELRIPTLSEYGTVVLVATDTGVSGKHIDIYTGEGKKAENYMYKITSDNNTVCLLE
jgi:3D (Asp-Asp-Asp) domain-containing protein